MSAVRLNEELNDSAISTSQSHEGTKKHKKRKHKTPDDDKPADISISTVTVVDGLLSEEKRKHKKKKQDKSSENNDSSIIEPSQSDAVEIKSKRPKSKSKEKPVKEPEIEEHQEPEDGATTEVKRKEKKKKRNKSSDNIDSGIEPSQSNVVENKRKRRKSHIEEEEQPTTAESEPLQDKELTQESRRKRRKTNLAEDVPNETEKEAEEDLSEEGNMIEDTFDNRQAEVATDVIDNSDSENFNLEKADVIFCDSDNCQIEEENVIMLVDKEHLLEDANVIKSVNHRDGACQEFNAVNMNQIPSAEKEFITTREKLSLSDRRKFISTSEKLSLTKTEVFNGMEEGDGKMLRRSNRKIVPVNSGMSEQDQQMLLARMLDVLPEHDGVNYLQRLEDFEWGQVKFGDFSVKNCQEQFNRVVAKIRKSRTLAEIIHDAQASSKKVTTLPRAKPLAIRSALQLYLKKKVDAYMQKHPGKSKREEAVDKYRSKWAALSDEEKVKYVRKAEFHITKFQEEIEKRCLDDPSYIPPRRLARLSKGDQKILDKVDGIPPKPLGSGYLLFCEMIKERLRTEMPDISNTKLTVEMGHRWSALSEERREHYKRKLEKKKQKYLEFLEAHPEIEAKVNADKRSKIVVKKSSRRIFSGEPVKPPTSGYMIFCKEILPTLTDFPGRDRMQEASFRWAALTEEQKIEYNEKMKAGMKLYLAQLQAFKDTLSTEDLQLFEEFHKNATPRTPKKSPSSPSKEIAGKQRSTPPNEVAKKQKKTAAKKAKSKSPIPNSKSLSNNGSTGDDVEKIDAGSTSDSPSEVF